jgi:hypothetical protein
LRHDLDRPRSVWIAEPCLEVPVGTESRRKAQGAPPYVQSRRLRSLSVLVDFLTNIRDVGSDRSRFQRSERLTKDATQLGINIHNQFETILRSARTDYDKNKLTVRRSRLAGTAEEEKVARNTGHQAYVRLVPRKFGKVVHLPSKRRCPQHKWELLLTSDQVVQKIVTDLVFAKSGCRKVITRYFGHKSYCRRTGKHYLPTGFEELATTVFGHSFKAWIVYQRSGSGNHLSALPSPRVASRCSEKRPRCRREIHCRSGYWAGKRFPPKCLAKAPASSGLAKQNTTRSLSSRRMK